MTTEPIDANPDPDMERFEEFLRGVHTESALGFTEKEKLRFLEQLLGERVTLPASASLAGLQPAQVAPGGRSRAAMLQPLRDLFVPRRAPALHVAFAYCCVTLIVAGAAYLSLGKPRVETRFVAVRDTVEVRVMRDTGAALASDFLEKARTAPVPADARPHHPRGFAPQREEAAPTADDLLTRMNTALRRQQRDAALYYFHQGAALHPRDARFWSAMAADHAARRDFTTAGALYRQAGELEQRKQP
jgi:hypothetical protein